MSVQTARPAPNANPLDVPAAVNRCDVIWHEPARHPGDSMPLGNGDLGLNVWVEPTGDVLLYISKTDAWDENGRLVKVGRVRLSLEPGLLREGATFTQRLDVHRAVVEIEGRAGDDAAVRVRLWVDANRPLVWIDVDADEPVQARATLELWRTEVRAPEPAEHHSFYDQMPHADQARIDPDTRFDEPGLPLVWCHRNGRSIWADTLRDQHLGQLIDRGEAGSDPLLHRTFGAALHGDNLQRTGSDTVATAAPARRIQLKATVLTRQAESLDAWRHELDQLVREHDGVAVDDAFAEHARWWDAFWHRSYIFASGDADAEVVTRGCTLQRYVNACAGRGEYPVKFNGSIFTFDTVERGIGGGKPSQPVNADYRRWGGPYWFQNTRLVSWAMLGAGDFEMMRPLFEMYRQVLPLAIARVREYYGHEGALFPETMHFWGAYARTNYGWPEQREAAGRTHPGDITGDWIRYYWSGALELAVMMLEYTRQTQDADFFADTAWPIIEAVLTFYEQHYPRTVEGKLRFEPAMALETWHEAINPTPEIAGLAHVVALLLDLPQAKLDEAQRQRLAKLRDDLPSLPLGERAGEVFIEPAASYAQLRNCENPELYAVFPYRRFAMNRPHLEIARATYERRRHRNGRGWCQDPIHAATLGLADAAAEQVARRFAEYDPDLTRFPAFWGPNFDWTPDQDHGNSTSIALQRMVVQIDRGDVVLPAWPKRWSLHFKLPGPDGTVIEGHYDAKTDTLHRAEA